MDKDEFKKRGKYFLNGSNKLLKPDICKCWLQLDEYKYNYKHIKGICRCNNDKYKRIKHEHCFICGGIII